MFSIEIILISFHTLKSKKYIYTNEPIVSSVKITKFYLSFEKSTRLRQKNLLNLTLLFCCKDKRMSLQLQSPNLINLSRVSIPQKTGFN